MSATPFNPLVDEPVLLAAYWQVQGRLAVGSPCNPAEFPLDRNLRCADLLADSGWRPNGDETGVATNPPEQDLYDPQLVAVFRERVLVCWVHGANRPDADETRPLEWLYYCNYLCKWFEFIDTFFLVLKKKKLQILHVYHHALTMALCHSQLVGKTSVSWVVCSINLLVHVIMYYYYYLSSRGINVFWKKYLTIFQISQFVVDICLCYFCLYTHMAFHNFPYLPNMGDCRGTRQAAYAGCFLLSTYLFLFVQFFVQVYSEGTKLANKKKLQAQNAAKADKNALPSKN
ncbi:Elongation of fatty acids protein 2 [Smittium mucronatum]|uniref:Elongation of fatty acids protein n=1 Tax=Smittium mucronatum TaxID=133383 RepID=A0A1R0H5Y3_9FUNG|nr:Elongation of fatty acids protein 2 [Smittium mucronatum]